MAESQQVRIHYKNHRGETGWRTIEPYELLFGVCPWHDGKQWLLEALDVEKLALRLFAMQDIKEWVPVVAVGSKHEGQ